MSFTNSTDAYRLQVKSCLMIMQTNMQTIGLRNKRPSSLVKANFKDSGRQKDLQCRV